MRLFVYFFVSVLLQSSLVQSEERLSPDDKDTTGNTPNKRVVKCGQSFCDLERENCYSWVLNENVKKPTKTSQKDCRKKGDALGQFTIEKNGWTSHHDPGLCPSGLTHAVDLEGNEGDCTDVGCGTTVKYKCVQENESPHYCNLRKCDKGFLCLEVTHCERSPPCVITAECHHISTLEPQHGHGFASASGYIG